MDNLNFYSAWLPAGQQTDRYSSQPWCLRSKNLDIFSSSKSVKATAFSQPVSWDSWVVASEWWLVLRADWKIYDSEWLLIDPSEDFPVYPICYTWEDGTYADAQRWTPMDMSVTTEWWEWKSLVAFTDRASFNYSETPYIVPKKETKNYIVYRWLTANWYEFSKTPWQYWRNMILKITVPDTPFAEPRKLKIRATQRWTQTWQVTLTMTNVPTKYYYDKATDSIVAKDPQTISLFSEWDDIFDDNWVTVDVPTVPWEHLLTLTIRDATVWPDQFEYNWMIYIDTNWLEITDATWDYDTHTDNVNELKHLMSWSTWDYNWYYTYLPLRSRKLAPVWEYYWMKWSTFQTLYHWEWSWVSIWWEDYVRYDFVQYMWWENEPSMDVIWMVAWNEQVYMIGNMNWNGYIIPCDLSWGRWTPYIAYGCTFTWVTNIDYLLYLVWEDRGISQLWVYNWQELVPVIWGREEKDSKNLIKDEEQYKFDWKIVNRRKNLILTTEDNRIFQYWQTFGGKGWVFIHELPSEATITWLKANWNNLEINYSITESWTTTNYTITYQDDTPIKNYNLEWMAEYPIVIWNHLLEKEESDLFVSYILPSSNCKLEFWGMANHYHFRTFTSSDSYTFSTTASYKMKGCTWNYVLKYIETNGNQYTFRLEWDLPIQTTNDMKITDTEWTELINYSEYNHFRKIGEITTTEYQEWEFRFHNLNNKLELPKSHSLQIMVKGKGNQNYTPELFALDLVANQRERW